MWSSVFSLVLASASFFTYRVLELRLELIETSCKHAEMLANSLGHVLARNNPIDAKELLSELAWHQSVDLAMIYDAEDRLFSQYELTDRSHAIAPPPLRQLEHYFTSEHLTVFRPIYFQDERIGTLCMLFNLAGMLKTIRQLLGWVVLILLFSSAMALLLATRSHRLISQPILELADIVRRVAEHNDDTLHTYKRGDGELGALFDEFKQMLGKIQTRDAALIEAQSRLKANAQELAKHQDHLEKLVAERTAHLKTAYEEIRGFVFMFSHDLRTPLVNIKGFSGELRLNLAKVVNTLTPVLPHLDEPTRKDLTEAINVDIPESLEFIEDSAGSMDRLINAILKLSFLGRRAMLIERVCVKEVMAQVLANLHQKTCGIEVVLGPLPGVSADATALEQVFENIISNAVSYLLPERPGLVEIWGEREEEMTYFHVRDNGQGISPEEIPKVFEPFRRLGSKNVQGLGMGMVYARTLVNRHGGKIWCSSELGVGTTFSFTIAHEPEQYCGYSPLGT